MASSLPLRRAFRVEDLRCWHRIAGRWVWAGFKVPR